jgi:hypothetical protein
MLVYATYLGGSKMDISLGMAMDAQGGVWLTGYTFSDDFPVTADAYQPAFAGGVSDAFLIRVDPSRPPEGFITYSTYFGGSGTDVSYGLALAGSGKVAIAGYTLSDDLPLKDPTPAGQSRSVMADAFVALLDTSRPGPDALAYSTYYGAANSDVAVRVAAGPSETFYIAGYTSSKSLPVTDGSLKPNPPGGTTGFLLRLDPLPGQSQPEVPPLLLGEQNFRQILGGSSRAVPGVGSKSGRQSR